MRRPALWQVVSKQSEAILSPALFLARDGLLFVKLVSEGDTSRSHIEHHEETCV